MRLQSIVVVAAQLALAACGGTEVEPELGELQGGIISGREQSVNAGATQLPEPVVNKVVRATSGGVTLSRATLNGTVVNGSPVVGAVVCVYEQDKDLVPFSRCTNTDTAGKATFFFTPPTKAGNFIARINGSVTTNGVIEATTFDTVKTTVFAGLPDSSLRGNVGGPRPSPANLASVAFVDKYNNPIPYRVTADSRITPRDTVIGSDSSAVIMFSAAADDTVMHSVVLVTHNETPAGNLWYRIRTVNGVQIIRWTICGFKITCSVA